MLSYIKRKIEKHKVKTNFKKYGHHIDKLTLKDEGEIEFAVWDNPLEKPKTVTQGDVDFYKKFIPKGCLAIDIGTHIGDTTVPMALAVGKEGTTIGFDPNPMVFDILMINAKLNLDKTNIKPFKYAIAVEPGEYFYNSSEATYNNGGISKEQESKHGKYQLENKVTGVKLLDFLRSEFGNSLDQLRFIKIDVEGLDLEILMANKELITSYRPTIVAECFKKLSKEQRFTMFKLFNDMDFELYRMVDFDAHSKFEKITNEEDMRKVKHFDFCAIPKERLAEIKL